MEASDVHNFLEYSFEQQKPWKDRINFLTAAVDRFLTLAGFSRTLSEDQRKRCIAASEKLATWIRAGADNLTIQKFEGAYAKSKEFMRLFGYGSAAFGLRESPEANPSSPLLCLTGGDAAQVQIDAAIEFFEKKSWACAITLGGAAEDRLPDTSESYVFGVAINQADTRNITSKDIADALNKARNWLKHNDADPKFLFVHEENAVFMLLRAISKFTANGHKQTAVMDRFEKYARGKFPHYFAATK